jgi:hypothetical protein
LFTRIIAMIVICPAFVTDHADYIYISVYFYAYSLIAKYGLSFPFTKSDAICDISILRQRHFF